MLTKEQILAADDKPIQKIDVPEWGGEVYARTMNGSERDTFEQAIVETKGNSQKVNLKNIRARLCAISIVDAEGKRLFADADIEALGTRSAKVLDRIFAVAQEMNGFSDTDVASLIREEK